MSSERGKRALQVGVARSQMAVSAAPRDMQDTASKNRQQLAHTAPKTR